MIDLHLVSVDIVGDAQIVELKFEAARLWFAFVDLALVLIDLIRLHLEDSLPELAHGAALTLPWRRIGGHGAKSEAMAQSLTLPWRKSAS